MLLQFSVENFLSFREPAVLSMLAAEGPALTDDPERAQFLRFVIEGTRSNQPFLAEARDRNVQELNPVLFTTHDTNLLDLTLLSRDAIWFTEKAATGATALYSLAEYKGDQIAALGPQLEKGYLQGRFGAIPFLGDLTRPGWKKDAAE